MLQRGGIMPRFRAQDKTDKKIRAKTETKVFRGPTSSIIFNSYVKYDG